MRRAAVLLVVCLLGAATAWAANPTAPKATTGSAGGVGTTSATLTGTVDSGNGDSTYQFDYGTSNAYGLTTPTATTPAATTPATVTATVTGLTSNTVYHFRLSANNAAGHSDGNDATFTTAAVAGKPTIGGGTVSGVTSAGATLNATVNPHALATTYIFQYGTTATYGSQTASASAGSGAASIAVKQAIGGLASSTTYHFRIVATNSQGSVTGSDHSFKTKAGATKVSVSTSAASKLGSSSAQLNGKINPNGLAASYFFQYGTSKSYGAQTATVGAGAVTKAFNVSAAVLNLKTQTTYHFRVVGTNANGTFVGGDRTFYTATGKLGLTLGSRPDPVVFGHAIALVGNVVGAGGGIAVTLHGQPFPFSGPVTQIGNAVVTDGNGRFRMVVENPSGRTKYFVTASVGGSNLTSPTVVARVRVKVGLQVTKLGGHLVRFHGTIRPAVAGAVVSIQRRAHGGRRWIRVSSASVLPPIHPGSALRFAKRMHVRTGVYRAVVLPTDGAHTRNVSRTRSVKFLHH
jgi:hypothetical protein